MVILYHGVTQGFAWTVQTFETKELPKTEMQEVFEEVFLCLGDNKTVSAFKSNVDFAPT